MMAIVFRVAVGSVLFAAQCLAESQPRIAIIIDDLGYQLDAGRRAIDLPGPVVCAILPGTPRARQLAQGAHDNGKEVLLHLPLQATARRGPLEPGGITLDMSRARLSAVFAEAIESVRRRGNVEQIISAETRVSGGRETHYIKVLTKDGKVQTHTIAGRKLG